MSRGLLDTSIFIAGEQGRPIGDLPEELAVSVVTLGELELGVLAADDEGARRRRARTLARARTAVPVPVSETTMAAFAHLVHDCRAGGIRPNALDALIAATGVDRGLPVFTQDEDFERMADAHPRLAVERV